MHGEGKARPASTETTDRQGPQMRLISDAITATVLNEHHLQSSWHACKRAVIKSVHSLMNSQAKHTSEALLTAMSELN